MKYTKELDEKLRAFLQAVEVPLQAIFDGGLPQNWIKEYHSAVLAMNIRKEIIEIINKPDKSGKFVQIDLLDAIEKEKYG